MSFIDEFDALAAENVQGRLALFFGTLASDWRTQFADLRARRPILQVGPFVVISRWADVVDALSRTSTFRAPYGPHMDPSVGPYMLARDEDVLNWRDKSLMRTLMRWDDLPGIRAFARKTAEAAVAGVGDTLEVVGTVSRLVPLRVVQNCFGFPAPDEAMLRWSRATQHDMFHNLENNPDVLATDVAAGTEMRAWLRPYLQSRQPWSTASGEDTVSRLLRATDAGLSGLDFEGVVSNVCGLLVGAVETASQAIVNTIEQILIRPDVTQNAIAAARGDDMTAFDAIVWEALRFNPMGTLIVRQVAEPARVAPGSDHETAVAPGQRILASIGSAMFDPAVFEDPEAFHVRPRDHYIHTGFGVHECLGRHVAYQIIPEAVRAVLLLSGIRLLDSGESKVDKLGGPFAERFTLGVGQQVAAPVPT